MSEERETGEASLNRVDGTEGYYYLHVNGDLIFKRFDPGEDDSSFIKRVWKIKTTDRGTAWLLLVEALAMGANCDRIKELADRWGVNDEDAPNFIKHATADGKETFKLFRDGDRWCAAFHDFTNIQESQVGFGDTCLEALAELAKPGLEQKFGLLESAR